MGGSADWRTDGWTTVRRTVTCLAVVLSGHPSLRLSAQVGHDPGDSPYHDIRRGAMVRAFGGYFSGSRGRFDVGASHGQTAGVRLEYQASNVLVFTTGIAYANTDAFFVTAFDTTPRTVGPLRSSLVLADAGLQVSLTGGKTFHGFQPYLGGTLGLVFGSTIAADTSRYQFGTKFAYAPEAGIRWYAARRLSFEVGGRVVYYKLRYPPSYQLHLLPFNAPLTEMTAHPWATAGVAWTF